MIGVTKRYVSNWETDNVLAADGFTEQREMHIRLIIKDFVTANNRVTVFKKRGFFDPTDRS